jgi:hypothetical protein
MENQAKSPEILSAVRSLHPTVVHLRLLLSLGLCPSSSSPPSPAEKKTHARNSPCSLSVSPRRRRARRRHPPQGGAPAAPPPPSLRGRVLAVSSLPLPLSLPISPDAGRAAVQADLRGGRPPCRGCPLLLHAPKMAGRVSPSPSFLSVPFLPDAAADAMRGRAPCGRHSCSGEARRLPYLFPILRTRASLLHETLPSLGFLWCSCPPLSTAPIRCSSFTDKCATSPTPTPFMFCYILYFISIPCLMLDCSAAK